MRALAAILLLAGPAVACDITEWPSSTHHPAPLALFPPADLELEYRVPDTIFVVMVHLSAVPADWFEQDAMVRAVAPGAIRSSIRIRVCSDDGREHVADYSGDRPPTPAQVWRLRKTAG